MEHLPIVIFEIVLCVFLSFAALAGILFQQIEEKKKKIKKLESELGILVQQYNELEKFVHSNTEMVVCVAEFEPMYYAKDPKKYLDRMCERIGYSIVNKMAENFNERMLGRIKELINDRCFGEILHTDVMSLRKNFKVSVPVFRVDYEYIKVADCENIFGRG